MVNIQAVIIEPYRASKHVTVGVFLQLYMAQPWLAQGAVDDVRVEESINAKEIRLGKLQEELAGLNNRLKVYVFLFLLLLLLVHLLLLIIHLVLLLVLLLLLLLLILILILLLLLLLLLLPPPPASSSSFSSSSYECFLITFKVIDLYNSIRKGT